jgi:hypothetical protein
MLDAPQTETQAVIAKNHGGIKSFGRGDLLRRSD